MTSKAQTQKKHSQRRASERLGIEMGNATYQRVITDIQSGKAKALMKQSNRVTLFEVEMQGVACVVAYDKLRKSLATVLTREMYDANGYDDYEVTAKRQQAFDQLMKPIRDARRAIANGKEKRTIKVEIVKQSANSLFMKHAKRVLTEEQLTVVKAAVEEEIAKEIERLEKEFLEADVVNEAQELSWQTKEAQYQKEIFGDLPLDDAFS